MIVSFGDDATEDLFHGRRTARVRRFPADVVPAAIRRLDALNQAASLADLRSRQGNRLEALSGQLAGFHSIRINDQWRVVFTWNAGDADDVRVIDYH